MVNNITMTLLVDKSCNRVVYAESNGDFVEVLLTFLTLPLASILRLTKKPPLGSMRKLFESVENLNSLCFRNETCKTMLLHPLNAVALVLPLQIYYDNCRQKKSISYLCKCHCSSRMSFYGNAVSYCGRQMNEGTCIEPNVLAFPSSKHGECMFPKIFKFIITDDLLVFQSSMDVAFELLAKSGIKQTSSLEFKSVDVTPEKFIELLERLCISDTPITDVFLGRHSEDNLRVIKQKLWLNCSETIGHTENAKVSVKLYLNQEESTVLFAEADNEFVDLLVSFLTYPIGSVVNKLEGNSSVRCFDNLFKSVETLKLSNRFKNHEIADVLQQPKLPRFYSIKHKLIKIDEEEESECSICTNCSMIKFCSDGLCNKCMGSAMGDYMINIQYTISNDLIVKQTSSIKVITDYLGMVGKMVHTKHVEIGEHEALRLLHASITSSTVFEDVFLAKPRHA